MGAFRSQTGEVVYAPDEQSARMTSLGYTPANDQELYDATATRDRVGDAVTAGVTGALSGATLGLSDKFLRDFAPTAANYVADSREAHPWVSGIGELGGALLTAHVPVAPAGALTSAGERIAAATASKLGTFGSRVAGEAAVGAGFSAGGYVSQAALEDKPLSAEGFVGAMGRGALFGGATSAALQGASAGLRRVKSMFPAHEVEAGLSGKLDQEATQNIASAVEDGQSMQQTAADELRRLRIQREATKAEQEAAIGQAKVESAQAKADAVKAKAEADKAVAEARAAKAKGKAPQETAPAFAENETAAPVIEAPPPVAAGASPQEAKLAAAADNMAKAEAEVVKKVRRPRADDEALKAWKEKYPGSATEHVTASDKVRKDATAQWAEDFQPKTDADEAIKAYFQAERDPMPVLADAKTKRNARVNGAGDVVTERPPEQDVANLLSADASHRAYQRATEAATNVAESGKEVFIRATYEAKKAAAKASDDFFARLNEAKAAGRAEEFLEATRKGFYRNAEGDLVRHMRGDEATAKLWNEYADAVGAGRGHEWLASTENRPFYYDEAGKLVRLGDEAFVAPRAAAQSVVPLQEQIADALHAHVGEHVNMGAEVAEAAQALSNYEHANHQFVEALRDVGAPVPSGAAKLADDYAAAVQQHSAGAAEQTAKTAEDLANKAAPRTMGSKLADLGGLLEMAGMHVPLLHAIPVIGPLIGPFLKARAFMAIAGKKGGSIAETAEAHIAAKASATRSRVFKAVATSLDAGSRATAKAASYAGAAQGLSYRLFPSDSKTPKKADAITLYHARMDELARAQQPGAIEAAVGDRIHTSDPALQAAIVDTVKRKVAFLADKAPKQAQLAGLLKGDGDWKPGKAQLDSFARYVHAAEDPASVLEDLAHAGQVSIEGAETLRVVYPSLYAEAQRALLDKASTLQKTLPYGRRVALSVMFGVPVDGTMSRAHLGYLQAGQPPAPPQQQAQPQPPHPSISGPVNLGQRTMTSADRRAGA